MKFVTVVLQISIWITLFSNDDRQLICSASSLFEKQYMDTVFLASLRPLNMERKGGKSQKQMYCLL